MLQSLNQWVLICGLTYLPYDSFEGIGEIKLGEKIHKWTYTRPP